MWCSFFSTPENRPQVADETWLSTHEVLLQVQGQSRKTNSRTHKKNRRNFRFLDKIVKRHRRNASRCSSVQPEKSQRSLNSSNSIHPSTIHHPIQQEKNKLNFVHLSSNYLNFFNMRLAVSQNIFQFQFDFTKLYENMQICILLLCV